MGLEQRSWFDPWLQGTKVVVTGTCCLAVTWLPDAQYNARTRILSVRIIGVQQNLLAQFEDDGGTLGLVGSM